MDSHAETDAHRVTAHLMGGMLLLAMLLWFWTRQRRARATPGR